MKDRVLNGLLAGFFAGLVAKAWSLSSYYLLHFSKFRLLDWMSAAVIGHPPRGFAETTLSFLLVLAWLTVAGIGLAYFLPAVGTRRGYLIKGWVYGLALFFLTLVLARLMQTPNLLPTAWQTVVTDIVSASLFGTTAAHVLKRLDHPAGTDGP